MQLVSFLLLQAIVGNLGKSLHLGHVLFAVLQLFLDAASLGLAYIVLVLQPSAI